jgi:predicted DNA-binding transcriptional regulator AlpA
MTTLTLLDTTRGAIAPTAAPQGLATAAQAAAFLSISRSTLWRLERLGTLTPVRVGRALRYRWPDLYAIAQLGTGGAK